MITERTLRRWRVDALTSNANLTTLQKEGITHQTMNIEELNNRVLRLTQELLDQCLLRKGKS